jgi:hypothetical protein
VKALLDKGACVDGRHQADVPVCRAVSNRYYKIAKLLLEQEAQVNLKQNGCSARSWLLNFEDVADRSVPRRPLERVKDLGDRKTSKYKSGGRKRRRVKRSRSTRNRRKPQENCNTMTEKRIIY